MLSGVWLVCGVLGNAAPGGATADRDGDGHPDVEDNCWEDANTDQANLDGDCHGDACDPDDDGDGVADTSDLCPRVRDARNADADDDGVGDVCDNCPHAYNPAQEDLGELSAGGRPDGVGDACDPAPAGEAESSATAIPWPWDAAAPIDTVLARATRAYVVRRGDSLSQMAQRFNLTTERLARMNDLRPDAWLMEGAPLRVDFERIVVRRPDARVVVNVPERFLYVFKSGELRAMMPVGVGKGRKRPGEDWRTPVGAYRVTYKTTDPTWIVPPSIQREMRRLGHEVLTSVAPGPRNPLGRWMVATNGRILFHETPYRHSVLRFSSHGCVRLLGDDMRQLYLELAKGDRVEVVYEPLKIARTEEPRVLMEVHPDPYGNIADLGVRAMRRIADIGAQEVVSWTLVAQAIEERRAAVVDVSRVCERPNPIQSAP